MIQRAKIAIGDLKGIKLRPMDIITIEITIPSDVTDIVKYIEQRTGFFVLELL